MIVVGGGPLGVEPVAGHQFLDDPQVTITPLGTVSSGGPFVPLSWEFNRRQEWYHVRILDSGSVLFDSGRRQGDTKFVYVDWDERELPTKINGLELQVSAGHRHWHVTYQDTEYHTFNVSFGDPQCDILRPGQVVRDVEDVEVEWAFSDDPGRSQKWYRVFLDTMAGVRLWDSGWVESSATSLQLPVLLSPGSVYRLGVQLKNDQGMRSE